MVHFHGNFYMTVHTFYGGIFTRFIVESQRLFMLKLSHFSVANSVILHTLYLLNFTTFRLYSAGLIGLSAILASFSSWDWSSLSYL